ncbi:MAG: DUF4399 domain-containing protein [Bradyrhizobium sp.]|nr:DUF4399 domain-containing protein [Bradyrhizobium sp.]
MGTSKHPISPPLGLTSLKGSLIARVKNLGSVALVVALMLSPGLVWAQGTPSPKDAYLYIISPSDGDAVKGAFWCRFGLRNMGVSHAGDNFANSGHHHLLIDADEPIDPGEPIPQDRKHLHYGAGETEALIELPPGRHTLQLVLSDGKHFNFDPPVVSKKITITVSGADADAASDRQHTVRHAHGRIKHHRLRTARPAPQTSTADAAPPENSKPSGAIEFLRSHLWGTGSSAPAGSSGSK